jgi:plastocyanin
VPTNGLGRRTSRRSSLVALVCVVVASAGVITDVASGATPKPAPTKCAASATQATGSTATVTILNAFTPQNVCIKVGQRVKWVWSTSNTMVHNVTLEPPFPKGVTPKLARKAFTSQTHQSNYTFDRLFHVAGVYHFHCTIHYYMHMSVTVVKK